MRPREDKRSGHEPRNPLQGLSSQDRKRYLNAARQRETKRKLTSFSKQLQKRDRKSKGASPDGRAHVLTDSWLVNRTLDEARAKPLREIPAWLAPLLILITLVLALFVILPLLVGQFIDDDVTDGGDQSGLVATFYADDIMVAKKAVVDVFSSPDIRSNRITQLLYNEPVTRLSAKNSSGQFVKLRLADGTIAYCRRIDLEEDSSSIEPDGSIAKLVVTDLSKRVMSHARNGNLLIEVKMNTELFVVYRADPLYRVKLADGQEGWLDSTGVLEIRTDAAVESAGGTYFSDSIMAFNHVTYLAHGLSNEGISMAAAIQVAASINGLEIARGIDGIWEAAVPIANAINENKTLNMNAFTRGDVLFFADEEGGAITKVAIWVDYGIVLVERPREFVIRETELNTVLDEAVFVAGGRLFEN